MIVKAVEDDLQRLTEIAIESKAYWGYTAEQIESWREDLTVHTKQFQQWDVYKFVSDKEIAGFYCLDLNASKTTSSLEFLFVLPKFIGKAIGSQLLQHAFQESIQQDKLKMKVLSDPNAASFYTKHGFVEISKEESSISGRFLPVMEKVL
jgi:N-acetylglutamate synthase-like GNAT family acetyltransferase